MHVVYADPKRDHACSIYYYLTDRDPPEFEVAFLFRLLKVPKFVYGEKETN
jgi:hypothetical protein